MATKKTFRISITILLILVVGGIILYPKLKPLFAKQAKTQQSGMRPGGARGSQSLVASGYVIVPTRLNELVYSTGSLLPDEEVDLSFETSGKIVGIYFEEGTRVKLRTAFLPKH